MPGVEANCAVLLDRVEQQLDRDAGSSVAEDEVDSSCDDLPSTSSSESLFFEIAVAASAGCGILACCTCGVDCML